MRCSMRGRISAAAAGAVAIGLLAGLPAASLAVNPGWSRPQIRSAWPAAKRRLAASSVAPALRSVRTLPASLRGSLVRRPVETVLTTAVTRLLRMARIDVSVEHRDAPEERDGKPAHPNTCPKCGSHYRDDELDQHLRVCRHCGHHFPVPARTRIEQLADEGSFVEEAAELRSGDPLGFFDLRPYTERLAEAEVSTGLG